MNWDLPDQPFEEFIQEWEQATLNPDFQPRSGDSVRNTALRLERFLRNRESTENDSHIVIVTHGGTIRDFLTMLSEEYKGILLGRAMEGVHECSITQVSLVDGNFQINCFDDIAHLE